MHPLEILEFVLLLVSEVVSVYFIEFDELVEKGELEVGWLFTWPEAFAEHPDVEILSLVLLLEKE